jgi:hypothetical protein
MQELMLGNQTTRISGSGYLDIMCQAIPAQVQGTVSFLMT